MPHEITIDLGHKYALLEPYIRERGDISRRKNVQTPNTVALVYSAIGVLKQIHSSYLLLEWAGRLQKAKAVYNRL